ncbi:MAG TPA: DUF3455 domain-containing protein [Steroidobacteraceae bacterium]|nr:DUF3455 domain-containing protein [Steroidobacteraceae bacterium]
MSTDLRGACLIRHAALCVLLAACAAPSRAPKPVIPEALQVPQTEKLALQARAVGVQIYQCQPDQENPARFDWVFKAPEAQLFDRAGKPIIKHFAGPSWEAMDGSAVVGELMAKDPGPDAMAIPWLLLQAKSTSGQGVLSHTRYIQRLDTVGGKAPQGGCSAALAGSEARVHYTADYFFYAPRSR